MQILKKKRYIVLLLCLAGIFAAWFVRAELTEVLTAKLLKNKKTLSAYPSASGLPYEQGNVLSGAGKSISYWWIPAVPGSQKAVKDKSVLIFHGQDETLDDWIKAISVLTGSGFNVMIFDYSGYGLSAPADDIDGWPHDVSAISDLFSRKATGEKFLLGFSMGGAVLLDSLAQVQPDICAIGLVSTFSSLKEVVYEKYPVLAYMPFLLPNYFDSKKRLKDIQVPIFLLHIENDEEIDAGHFQRLAAIRNEQVEPVLIKGLYRHNQFWQQPNQKPFSEVVAWFQHQHCDKR